MSQDLSHLDEHQRPLALLWEDFRQNDCIREDGLLKLPELTTSITGIFTKFFSDYPSHKFTIDESRGITIYLALQKHSDVNGVMVRYLDPLLEDPSPGEGYTVTIRGWNLDGSASTTTIFAPIIFDNEINTIKLQYLEELKENGVVDLINGQYIYSNTGASQEGLRITEKYLKITMSKDGTNESGATAAQDYNEPSRTLAMIKFNLSLWDQELNTINYLLYQIKTPHQENNLDAQVVIPVQTIPEGSTFKKLEIVGEENYSGVFHRFTNFKNQTITVTGDLVLDVLIEQALPPPEVEEPIITHMLKIIAYDEDLNEDIAISYHADPDFNVTIPAQLIPSGYEFEGWRVVGDLNITDPADFDLTLNEDQVVTLTGNLVLEFNLKGFYTLTIVTYDENADQLILEQTVQKNSPEVIIPKQIIPYGYVFKEWVVADLLNIKDAESFDKKLNEDQYVDLVGDMTLTLFISKVYTLTIVWYEDGVKKFQSKRYDALNNQAEITVPKIPEGKEFGRWVNDGPMNIYDITSFDFEKKEAQEVLLIGDLKLNVLFKDQIQTTEPPSEEPVEEFFDDDFHLFGIPISKLDETEKLLEDDLLLINSVNSEDLESPKIDFKLRFRDFVELYREIKIEGNFNVTIEGFDFNGDRYTYSETVAKSNPSFTIPFQQIPEGYQFDKWLSLGGLNIQDASLFDEKSNEEQNIILNGDLILAALIVEQNKLHYSISIEGYDEFGKPLNFKTFVPSSDPQFIIPKQIIPAEKNFLRWQVVGDLNITNPADFDVNLNENQSVTLTNDLSLSVITEEIFTLTIRSVDASNQPTISQSNHFPSASSVTIPEQAVPEDYVFDKWQVVGDLNITDPADFNFNLNDSQTVTLSGNLELVFTVKEQAFYTLTIEGYDKDGPRTVATKHKVTSPNAVIQKQSIPDNLEFVEFKIDEDQENYTTSSGEKINYQLNQNHEITLTGNLNVRVITREKTGPPVIDLGCYYSYKTKKFRELVDAPAWPWKTGGIVNALIWLMSNAEADVQNGETLESDPNYDNYLPKAKHNTPDHQAMMNDLVSNEYKVFYGDSQDPAYDYTTQLLVESLYRGLNDPYFLDFVDKVCSKNHPCDDEIVSPFIQPDWMHANVPVDEEGRIWAIQAIFGERGRTPVNVGDPFSHAPEYHDLGGFMFSTYIILRNESIEGAGPSDAPYSVVNPSAPWDIGSWDVGIPNTYSWSSVINPSNRDSYTSLIGMIVPAGWEFQIFRRPNYSTLQYHYSTSTRFIDNQWNAPTVNVTYDNYQATYGDFSDIYVANDGNNNRGIMPHWDQNNGDYTGGNGGYSYVFKKTEL